MNDDFSDSELQLDGYNIFRFDRANRRGDGVLLAINSRLSCIRRYDLEIEGVEMLVGEIHTSGSRCLIFSVFYRPLNAHEAFLDGFRTFLRRFNGIGISDLIITGDFNFPHIDWSTVSPTNLDTQAEYFCDILNDSFLIQMNGFVTRPSSTTNHSSGKYTGPCIN